MTSQFHNLTTGAIVDRLGALKAQLADLKRDEETLRGELIARFPQARRQHCGSHDASCRTGTRCQQRHGRRVARPGRSVAPARSGGRTRARQVSAMMGPSSGPR
jgi:hypothetical protein